MPTAPDLLDGSADLDEPPARRSRDEPEHRLSHWCGVLLGRVLLEPCWFTAQDTAGRAIGASWSEQAQSRMRWHAKQKWYGVKPDQLDWRIFQKPVYAEIELKYGEGRPTAGQERTMRSLFERGIPTGCAWTVREFYDLLVKAGFQLHANAPNIVREIAERYAAAGQAARIKQKAPRAAAPKKARPVKPSATAIRRTHAARGRVKF